MHTPPQAKGEDVPGQEVLASRRRIAIFASVDSFEGFYGGTFHLTRQSFLKTYRNDFLWQYGEGLRALGHEVFLYIRSYGPAALHTVKPGLHVRFLHLPSWAHVADHLLFRLRTLAQVPVWRERISYAAYGGAFQQSLKDDRIDLLYHQEVWTPRFDLLVQRCTLPVVGADHGALYQDWMAASKRRALQAAAGVTCQSQDGLKRVQALGGQGVVLYNGVDVDFFCPPEEGSTRAKTILAVGRFVEQQKRFADLLRAMQDLPDFRLVLAGSGPDDAHLRSLAQQLQISERVEFLGFVSDRQRLKQLYQQCGVFVCSSAWEAAALVVLEAMSCGAPVVLTRIPSFLDLLQGGEGAILVPVGAPEQLAAAIREAFEAGRRLGDPARLLIQTRYSEKALYLQLSTLLERIELRPDSR